MTLMTLAQFTATGWRWRGPARATALAELRHHASTTVGQNITYTVQSRNR